MEMCGVLCNAIRYFFFALIVEDIMTTTHKIINQNAKLTDASKLMRDNNIHSLIIVDDEGKLVGTMMFLHVSKKLNKL